MVTNSSLFEQTNNAANRMALAALLSGAALWGATGVVAYGLALGGLLGALWVLVKSRGVEDDVIAGDDSDTANLLGLWFHIYWVAAVVGVCWSTVVIVTP